MIDRLTIAHNFPNQVVAILISRHDSKSKDYGTHQDRAPRHAGLRRSFDTVG